MGMLILKIIGLFFGFGDQNEGSLGLKIVGFLVTLIGTIILFVIKIWQYL